MVVLFTGKELEVKAWGEMPSQTMRMAKGGLGQSPEGHWF